MTIRRKNDSELDSELRPIYEPPNSGLPRGSELINSRFIEFGGNPMELDDMASIASAGLVIAEQIAELTTALYSLTSLNEKETG